MYCRRRHAGWKPRSSSARFGPVVKTKAGNLVQNPYLAVANRAMDQMLLYARELGMTPSSRSRIQLPVQHGRPVAGGGALQGCEPDGGGVGFDESLRGRWAGRRFLRKVSSVACVKTRLWPTLASALSSPTLVDVVLQRAHRQLAVDGGVLDAIELERRVSASRSRSQQTLLGGGWWLREMQTRAVR